MMNKLLTTIALSATLLFMNSCKKDKDDSPSEPSNYMVVHSSPGSSPVELYLDDVKASASAVPYGNASAYATIAAKQYNVKLAASNTINAIAETSVNLNSGRFYSIYAYDTLLSGKIKVFATEDDLAAPAAGKAKVRFLHLSPTDVAVDILANNTVVFGNRKFADNVSDGSKANFAQLDAGTYTIDVKLAGSNAGSLLTVPGITVEAGKIYTVIARGKVTGTGDAALGVQLITNK